MEAKKLIRLRCPECKERLYAEKGVEHWYCGYCGFRINDIAEAADKQLKVKAVMQAPPKKNVEAPKPLHEEKALTAAEKERKAMAEADISVGMFDITDANVVDDDITKPKNTNVSWIKRPHGTMPGFPDAKSAAKPTVPDIGIPDLPTTPEVKTPEVPKVPEVKAPEAPKVPEIKAPEAPKVPEVKAPVAPKVPEVKAPEAPKVPEVKAPVAPKVPEVKAPVAPKVPEIK
ncbi:MAG TPA: hypothetical protein PLS20_11290, partial [Ruminococcus flavefaciens]|nr:hypothetical protein [Ruminococcus flavefaciens]